MQWYRAQEQTSTKPLSPSTYSQKVTYRRHAHVEVSTCSVSVTYVLSRRCNEELSAVIASPKQECREDVDHQVDPEGYPLHICTRALLYSQLRSSTRRSCFLPTQKYVKSEVVERHNSLDKRNSIHRDARYPGLSLVTSLVKRLLCLFITGKSLYTFVGGYVHRVPAPGEVLTFKDSCRPIFAIQSQGPYQRSQIYQEYDDRDGDSCFYSKPPATELFCGIQILSGRFLRDESSV
jgi:hypothetical protein